MSFISNESGPNPPHSPLSSRAKPRDLHFPSSATKATRIPPLPFVISSEANGSALSFISNESDPNPPTPLCHPERSRGLCSFLHQQRKRPESAPLPIVIPSEAEGSAVSFISNQSGPNPPTPHCHPERSRGICGSLHQQRKRPESDPNPPHSPLSSRAKPRDLQLACPGRINDCLQSPAQQTP